MPEQSFSETAMQRITRADGVTKEIRVQDGHLFVCQGCCCGRTDKGFPALPLDEFKEQWKARGIRRRFHLTVSGCLGPCPLANVVLILFRGRSLWLHSINSAEDVRSIYAYVEDMLRAEEYLDPPPELMSRSFERYLSQAGDHDTCESQAASHLGAEYASSNRTQSGSIPS
jgi:cobaltochelatase CobN